MDQSMQTAIRQIDTADLSAAQYRAARRLLDVAGQTGHVKLTKSHANERCATTTDGATRRLLGGLQAAGIIHYSVNGFVYVDFTAWSPMDKLTHPRTFAEQEWLEETDVNLTGDKKSDHGRALLDHENAKSDHPRALLDREGVATYTPAHAGGVCLFVDPDPIPSTEINQTNKQTPDPESQALSFALLTHVRVKAAVAKELAALHPLTRVREAVSHWWFNRKSVGGTFEETPGIVVYWLTNWQAAGVPALSPHFYRIDLYRNHRTQVEIADDNQIEADAQAALARPAVMPSQPVVIPSHQPTPTTPPATDPNAAIWSQLLAELKLTMQPTVYNQWVAGATVASVEGNAWRIVAPNAQALDYLNAQLSNKVRRILSVLLKQSVTVQFCLPEAKS